MREFHPNVLAARDATRELRHRIADLREKVDSIVARRPSPSGLAIPEVDAYGRLRDLYLAPGACARLGSAELADDITSGIVESTEDARRQYNRLMHDREGLPRPLAEVMHERWGPRGARRRSPLSESKNDEHQTGGGKD